ncbi:protein kinase [Plantactinospora siamensis]|uniref:serine/threonine-protein kinase n=1 Tax=Plantactinospora siamensis TaxID=555372 RepID=UPI0035EA04EC
MAHRYELTYPVGRGGMGVVWAGFDEKLDRPVAIKFLSGQTIAEGERGNVIERFMREARVTARLDHPGVPSVHDVGHHGDDLYIVMQLVPGVVLADLIAEHRPFPIPWAAAIGAQICSVLAAAHAASLVHRDLKPQNVMVMPSGAVKVLDFGVAALLGADVPRLTATSDTLGTPTYMAPEQALNNNAVGPRADLYALGCVLFEMLTGAPPYRAESPLGMLHRHMNDPVPLVGDDRDGVPDDLAELVTRLLAKDPQDRLGSAAEVYEILAPLGAVPTDASRQRTFAGGDQSVDPTMPYRYPFGPLPRRANPPTKAEAAQASPASLAAAVERSRELAEAERFTQAAELLESVLKPIRGAAAKQPKILELRLDLANLHFLAGAFRQALPEFTSLVADLSQRPAPDRELIWHCRQQAAMCRAELGETGPALAGLRLLLEEQRRSKGSDSPELMDLRQQTAVLAASAGQVPEAIEELSSLLADMEVLAGDDSPEVHELRTLLDHLHRLAERTGS